MKFEIKNRWSGNIIYQAEAESFAALVQAAVKATISLYGANLNDANLSGANLYGANLYGADLRGANLYGADLRGANLYGADLRGANLRGANLYGADLRGANLYGANLNDANLSGADLRGANLYGADLRGAKNISDRLNAESMIVPESGAFEGWKQCRNHILVHVLIPADAKRSNATGRKCRASYVQVIEVIGSLEGFSTHDNGRTVYRVGETVTCDSWNEDRWTECGGGIHFFITRKEAELY